MESACSGILCGTINASFLMPTLSGPSPTGSGIFDFRWFDRALALSRNWCRIHSQITASLELLKLVLGLPTAVHETNDEIRRLPLPARDKQRGKEMRKMILDPILTAASPSFSS
jgi:hypothetical protein